jgi:hypothetical protein
MVKGLKKTSLRREVRSSDNLIFVGFRTFAQDLGPVAERVTGPTPYPLLLMSELLAVL